MKFLALLSAVCAALALAACGGDSSADATQSGWVSTEVTGGQAKLPEVLVPPGPPPKKLVVKDLKKGSGAALGEGDEASVRYFNFDYKTDEVYEERWDPAEPFVFSVGAGEVLDAWETGLKGMRVGGRRELVVPAKIAYGKVDQIYVIDLLAVK